MSVEGIRDKFYCHISYYSAGDGYVTRCDVPDRLGLGERGDRFAYARYASLHHIFKTPFGVLFILQLFSQD